MFVQNQQEIVYVLGYLNSLLENLHPIKACAQMSIHSSHLKESLPEPERTLGMRSQYLSAC